MLHSYVAFSGQEMHSISGPAQLRELGDRNLERLINLNASLTDVTAYKGGDVNILVGLYAIPGQDAGKIMIDTLSSVAGLAGLAVVQAAQIANLVKSGVEGMLGLDEASMQLGVRDTFSPGNPFCSGHYLAVNAPADRVELGQLWLRGGQLVKGTDPMRARPYDEFDYIVIELEHRDRRDDWPQLPGMKEMNDQFSQIMADKTLTSDQKRERLRVLWPEFQNVLITSPFLIGSDKQRVAKSVADDLNTRLTSQNPFETRGWGDTGARKIDPAQFDMLDVSDTFGPNNQDNLKQAKQALEETPF